MVSIGFTFLTNDFRYVVLNGSKQSPVFVEKERFLFPKSYTIPQQVQWMETQLNLILDKYNPDIVGYKASLNVSKMNQIQHVFYAEAILHLCCAKRSIEMQHYFQQSIVPSKLGLPKGTDMEDHVDQVLGAHPPYWDKHSRSCALIAWFLLREE